MSEFNVAEAVKVRKSNPEFWSAIAEKLTAEQIAAVDEYAEREAFSGLVVKVRKQLPTATDSEIADAVNAILTLDRILGTRGEVTTTGTNWSGRKLTSLPSSFGTSCRFTITGGSMAKSAAQSASDYN